MGYDDYFRFFIALVFVLALIGALALIARRAGIGFPAHAIKTGGDRRIGVVEVAPLDARRKLILVRRDNTEHLLVVSPTSETVIERNIDASKDTTTNFKTTLIEQNQAAQGRSERDT